MKKHIKKLSYLICILLVAAMLSSGDFAFAFLDYDEGELSLLQEGDFDIEISEKNSDFGAYDTAAQKIYKELLNVSSQINIFLYQVPLDEVGALLSNVINDHPDLFYVSSTYRTSNITGYSYTYAIIPYYTMNKSEIESARTVFNEGVNKALSTVDSSMNAMQKALTIHDYMCDMSAYPDDAINNDNELFHSAYGFFLDGNVVCAGYTLAYSYLMHELGIECEYVSSSGMRHAWNKIKINGKWYNVDLTYDDFDYYSGYNTYGSMHHIFFLKSDSYFSGAQGLYHYDGKTYDTTTASSTDLDNYFWDDVNSRIYTLNGDFYYINPDFENYSAYLTKRTADGIETTIGSSYNSAATSGVLQARDENGVLQGREYSIVLTKLAFLDGRFYIASNLKLYSQLLSGERYTIDSIDYYPSGISVRDNSIVYDLYGRNQNYKLDKLEYFENNITTPKGGYNNYPDINNDGYVNAKDYAQIIAVDDVGN